MTQRRHLLAACTAMGGALLAPSLAQAQTLGPQVKISGGSIFNRCTADHVGSQPGTVFQGSAIEPWIAVDPTTAGHLLTGVQQDRWSNGGARGLRAGVSVNSGRNWTTSVPQDVSLCTGGPFQRSTDPWTAFGLDGTAYFFSLAFNNNPTPPINGASAMLVSRSTDGGVTWSAPTYLINDTDPLAFNDKNSLTTDPNIPGNVYAVWDRLYGPPTAFRAPGGSDENGASSQAVVDHDGLQMARNRIASSRLAAAQGKPSPVSDTFGPTYFARSTNSGLTWSRASPIYDPGRGAQTIANLIVGQPSGKLLDFFTHIDAQGNTSIATVSSFDHGFSWSRNPILVAPTIAVGAITPESHKPLRDASLLFSPTVDPTSGNLYVAWEQPVGKSGISGVLFTQSTDNGSTWSAPVKINATPANTTNKLRGQAFNPTLVAAPDGTLAVTYYDFRNDTGPAGHELADAWVLFCTPAGTAPTCTDPGKWGHEGRLTNTSFNIDQAPLTDSGYFLGDYFGLVAQGSMVWPAFTAVVGPGQTDLYTRPIRLGTVSASAQ